MQPTYHEYDDEYLTRDVLMNNESFLKDATYFLIDRANYDDTDLNTKEKIFDAYLEHFRRQNVNEVTAIKDMNYANRADELGKQRMSRLMDTFDRVDVDFNWTAAGDYAEGILTAPSTVAGLFSFGAGKAAAATAQQGIKFGIKQALKGGARGAGGALAVDVPATVATVGSQEQTRVNLGMQEDIDLGKVGTAAAISTVLTGTLGGATGALKAKRQFDAEDMISGVKIQEAEEANIGYEKTKSVYKNNKLKKVAKNLEDKLSATGKYALSETVPKEMEAGAKKLSSLTPSIEGASLLPDPIIIRNIAAAGAKVIDLLPPLEGVVKGSKEDLKKRILDEHKVAPEQLASLILEDGGDIIAASGTQYGKGLRSFRTAKEAKEIILELDAIDNALQNIGDFTSSGRRKLMDETKFNVIRNAKQGISNLNKAGVGLMTIQLATTVRNTTNGYMRNYMYALDNLGAGLIDYVGGNIKKIASLPDSALRQEAINSVEYGKAQLRTGIDSLLLKDLIIGMDSVTTHAMYRLLKEDKFGASELSKRVFREMADVGDGLEAQKGVLGLARKLNYFNTLSDNMFKRAIYARELDKSIRASTGGQENLKTFIQSGRFRKDLDISVHKNAMEQALEFTYQSDGFKAKPGWFNAGADAFIKFGQSAGTIVATFPRYMVNSLKFTYEHAPIIGMFDLPGAGIVTGTATERMSKQLGGLTTLGAFMYMRANLGDENTSAYEYRNPVSGELMNVQALLGPFTAFAVLADTLYRMNTLIPGFDLRWHDNDRVNSVGAFSARELVQSLTGGQGRGGTQLDMIDAIVNGVTEESKADDFTARRLYKEVLPKILGDYFNRFFVGMGVIKDVVGTVDPEFAKVPDNTDVNFMQYFFKRVTRSFPQTIGEDAEGLFGYTGFGPNRNAKLESPTRTGGVEAFNPIIKQIYGVSEMPRRTAVEKELNRLKFDYLELSPSRIQLDAPLSNQARGMMGMYMENNVANFIQSSEYKNTSDSMKRDVLKDKVNEFRTLAKNAFLNPEFVANMDAPTRKRRMETLFFNKGTRADRRAAFEAYRQQFNAELTEDENWEWGLAYLERRVKYLERSK